MNRKKVQDLKDELEAARNALQWYKRRCDALQKEQHRMRDPERTMVCDILANGGLLYLGTGVVDSKRYAVKAALAAAKEADV